MVGLSASWGYTTRVYASLMDDPQCPGETADTVATAGGRYRLKPYRGPLTIKTVALSSRPAPHNSRQQHRLLPYVNGYNMKTRSVLVETMFLQAVIVLIAIGALAFLLWEPHLEGRNANATPFAIYFNDPLLAYAYVASVSFFVALYKAFKVLGYAGTNRLFSHAAVRAVRTIRFCAIAMIAFVVVGEVLVLPNADELPPPVFMGLVIVFGSTVIATAMSVLEHVLQEVIGVASESAATP